jgi:hypothetical protein
MSKQKTFFFTASPDTLKTTPKRGDSVFIACLLPALMPLRCVSFQAIVQHFETRR